MSCSRNPGHSGERYLCLSHPDFHMPADALIGQGFDADAYVRSVKSHGVDALAMFASCHYGHCYYPSDIGRMHPRLDFDMFGRVARACREHELGCTRIRNDLVIHLVNQAGRGDLGGHFYPVLRHLPEIRDIRVFISRPAEDLSVLHIPDQTPVRVEQVDEAASFIAHPLSDLESYIVPDWFQEE